MVTFTGDIGDKIILTMPCPNCGEVLHGEMTPFDTIMMVCLTCDTRIDYHNLGAFGQMECILKVKNEASKKTE